MDKLKIAGLAIVILYLIYLTPLNNNIPQEMIDEVNKIKDMSNTQQELVRNVYGFVNQSYTSEVRQYLKEPNKFFHKDTSLVWSNRGQYYMSNSQNDMVKKMLLLSGKFEESDFRLKQGWCEISPHSVLFVKMEGNTEIAIDTWFADNNGAFNCYTKAPCGAEQMICLESLSS